MLVRNWMSTPAVTIDVNASMQEAVGLLKQRGIRMLPVMEHNLLVGVVTDGDLKKASASEVVSFEVHELLELIARIKVKTVMTPDPVTVAPDSTIEETAALMFVHNISGVPVVDHAENLVGVITKTDLFKVIFSLAGFSKKGVQFAFKVIDRPGAIKDITDILRDNGGRIASVLSMPSKTEKGFLYVYVRAYGFDAASRQRVKKVIIDKTPPLYIVDHEENTRTIYES